MKWPIVPLGDLFAERVPVLDPQRHPNEIFQLWSIPAFDAGKPEVILGSEIGSAKKCLEPGDVLLSKIVPHVRRSWIVGPNRGHRQIGSGEWIVFRSKRMVPQYLRHFLTSDEFHTKFMGTIAGVGGSLMRARPEAVKQFELPLPPLDEQRRIAAILDQADTLRRKRREALDLLAALEDATFIDAMNRQDMENSDGALVALENVALLITDGEHQTPIRSSSGHRLLSARNVQMGRLDFNDVDFLGDEEFARIAKRCATRRDDILISCSGTIGRVSVVEYDEPMCLVRSAALVRPNKALIEPLFLEGYLRTQRMQQIMKRAANASGQPNLFQGPIRQLPILLPPMETQRYVADAKRAVRTSVTSGQAHLARLDALFASLQHRAFNGKLTAKVAERELTEVG